MSKFTINNQILDVESSFEFPFLLKKNVFSQGEIGARGGVRGVSVKFPPTDNNFLIFDKNCEYDNNNKFYTALTYNLIIETDRVIFRGQFYISEYSKKEGIKGFYISNLTNWVNDIAGKSLKDIQSLQPINFDGMNYIIQDQYDFLYVSGINHIRSHDIIFPLIAYGTYFLPYWSKRTKYIDCTDYTSIVDNPAELIGGFEISNSDIPHLGFGDIPPSFYVANLFKAIFNDIGWTVSGSFFNSEEASKLIMPYVGDSEMVWNWGFLCDVLFSRSTSHLLTATDRVFSNEYEYFPLTRLVDSFKDTGFNCNSKYVYGDFFVPEDGVYEFDYSGSFEFIYSNLPVDIVRPVIGFFFIGSSFELDIVESQTPLLPGTPSWSRLNLFESSLLVDLSGNPQYTEFAIPQFNPSPGTNIINFSNNFQTELKKGDIIRFLFIGDEINNLLGVNILNYSASIKNISGDQQLQISKNLPDLSQTEFIESLINQFNLYFITNDDKKIIYFEKRDNFYLQNNVALDVSEYCTIKDFTIIPNDVPERFKFTYADDSNDYLNPKSEFEYLTIYQNQQDEKVIELPFAAARTAKFTTVINTLPITAANLQNPNFRRINEFDLNIIAGEEQFNSVQFDSDNDKFQVWNFDYVPRILSLKLTPLEFSTFGYGAQFRKWSGVADVMETVLTVPTAEFLPLEWSELIANWRQFLFLIQHSDTRTIQVKMDSKLWNEIESNVPIRIKGDYYILQEIGEFRILQKNDIVELTLIKLYR